MPTLNFFVMVFNSLWIKVYSPESVLRTVDNSGYHVSLLRYWHFKFC